MRVSLVGADLEENLGLGMIAASLRAARHKVDVVSFNEAAESEAVARRVLARRPHLVGLGIQFQHRAHDFLSFARRLRKAGYRGHITCGGQFSTMACAEILSNDPVDSIVLHEGERTVVELAQALTARRSLCAVRGLALRSRDAGPVRTAPRPLMANLDELPFPFRYREHCRHLAIPFIPISGGRGCWGSCAFCSITTFYRDARAYGGGRKLRLRSPESIAAEMALLWHKVGGPAIFCFHDDTFLLPRPADSLARVTAIRQALDELGVGKVGMMGKCRPECLTLDLAKQLRKLGVIRLYVGVENASQHGQNDLGRRTRAEDVQRAIGILNEAGIFGCYNLLLFEPDATLDDVRENIAFIRQFAGNPVNFCRAEAYHGTPLYLSLKQSGGLGGSYLGWDYRLRDDRTELLFRICSAAFRERNFHPRGVANRYMGLCYLAQLLEYFYDDTTGRKDALIRRAKEVTREVSTETADFLEQALELAASVQLDDTDRIERETALLGLRIAAHDRVWHVAFDELVDEMRDFVKAHPRERVTQGPPRKLREVVQSLALAGCLAVGAQHCGGDTEDGREPVPGDAATGGSGGAGGGVSDAGEDDAMVVDPLPVDAAVDAERDVMVVDMLPIDGGWYDPVPEDGGWYDPVPYDAAVDVVEDVMIPDPLPPDGGWYDPLPPDASVDAEPDVVVVDMVPPDGGWYDPLPPDAGLDGASDATDETSPPPVDPPPPDGGWYDPLPPDAGAKAEPSSGDSPLIDHWQDTAPKRAVRSRDLPLFEPPVIKLAAQRDGDFIEVGLEGGPEAVSIRWETRGRVQGEERNVRWQPESDEDQLRVAVRSAGGVAVATLRASSLPKSAG